MAQTTPYLVQPGDWLAKIAEEHGSTVSAIWTHPENADHRARRRSPNVLFPGDVLHIPVGSAAPVPIEPPSSPPPSGATGLDGAPWPYEPLVSPPGAALTWECPEDTCACHPIVEEDEERRDHVIVLHDPRGKRMPLARCRVVEHGRVITADRTTASPLGEVTLALPFSTRTLLVEWAPPELPGHDFMPYRKLYHVHPGVGPRAIDLRLSNLGFCHGGRRRDNVIDYQRAYGEPETGDHRDIELEVLDRHDAGQLPAFSTLVALASTPAPNPAARSFFASSSPTVPPTVQGAFFAPPANTIGAPGGGQGTQGALVPNAAHVLLMVGIEPLQGPLKIADITARLRPVLVPGLLVKQQDELIEPSIPGMYWEDGTNSYVVFVFLDVPIGRYAAMAHVANVVGARVGFAMGSADIQVTMGLLNLGYVGAVADRPILSVADPLLDLDVPPMQRRRKVLATVFNRFPQSADFQASAKGLRPPYEQGEYQWMLTFDPKAPQNSCAPVNTAMMTTASGTGHIYGTNLPDKHPGFVEFAPGLAPSVGDSFYLWDSQGHFEHCGIVIRSSLGFDEVWLTADGGQPDRTSPFQNGAQGWRRYYEPPLFSTEAAYIVPRLFRQSSVGPTKASLSNVFILPGTNPGGGYLLRGWGDITHPSVPFGKSAYDKTGSEADYRALKQRASRIPGLVSADRQRCVETEALASLLPKPPP